MYAIFASFNLDLLSIIPLVLVLALIAILIVILIFEIKMFAHAVYNQAITNERQVLWLIGMFVIHPFVAIVYYFTDYQRGGGPVVQ